MTDSVYTVTPPDLRVTDTGPCILMLGIPFDDSEPYVNMFDELFSSTDVTIYTSEDGLNENNLSWYRATVGMASTVIADIDNITPEELLLVMQAEASEQTLVFWISAKQKDSMLYKLLNSYQYSIFTGPEEVKLFFESQYGDKKG